MTKAAEALRRRYFSGVPNPYTTLEQTVRELAGPGALILDAGCGRSADRLARLMVATGAQRAIGVDLVSFTADANANRTLELHNADLASVPVESGCVDVIFSVSVMEHLVEPTAVYEEMFRLLKPGGYFVFLTPNLWDYAALLSKLIPNRFHPSIVAWTEGRREEDTFPAYYRSNTRRSIRRLAVGAGFDVVDIVYLGQYPSYFLFNRPLFLLGTAYQKTIERFRATRFLQGWILARLYKPAGLAGGRRQPAAHGPAIPGHR